MRALISNYSFFESEAVKALKASFRVEKGFRVVRSTAENIN